MDLVWLLPLLALGTISAVLIFAIVSKARVEERRTDPQAPKSTLAADAPSSRR
ncbi:MAG: hypothetical protein JJU19_11630 [Pararhodobacter sp.]|nr:hypothetical protein [Pararhodobacter sp.]